MLKLDIKNTGIKLENYSYSDLLAIVNETGVNSEIWNNFYWNKYLDKNHVKKV